MGWRPTLHGFRLYVLSRTAVRAPRRAALSMADANEPLEALAQHKKEGNALYQQGEYAAAISAYAKGVRLLPDLDDEDEPSPSAELRKQASRSASWRCMVALRCVVECRPRASAQPPCPYYYALCAYARAEAA